MKNNDLRKLNRYQLLELLVLQTERADNLQARLDKAEEQLRDREIRLSSLGSIAEASLQLSGIFQAAQQVADQYVNAAKQQADAIVAEAEAHARRIKGE